MYVQLAGGNDERNNKRKWEWNQAKKKPPPRAREGKMENGKWKEPWRT
jgi:hypothetical protein